MDNKKLLVVDDSRSIRKILSEILRENGYEVVSAENGKAAYELVKKIYFSVVIADLEMPVMNGCELIDRIRGMDLEPVIIVLTSHSGSDRIIDTMKKGVFDYIIKPVKKNDLLMKIEKALRVSELNNIKRITERERIIRLERQLAWYRWEERVMNKSNILNDSNLFKNLNRSFSQGSGFGSLMTVINLISSTARNNGSGYEIDKDVFDLLIENKEMAVKAMKIFSEVEHLTSSDLAMERIPFKKLYGLINRIIGKVEGFAKIKDQYILLSDYKSLFDQYSVPVNLKYFQKVILEILINAMKFGGGHSDIVMMLGIHDRNAVISVINSIDSSGSDNIGIPKEFENIVFEPFFRIVKYIQEPYKTLDFGLGLTVVEKIIQRHRGRVSIYNIMDHSNIMKSPEIKVNCTVSLPLVS